MRNGKICRDSPSRSENIDGIKSLNLIDRLPS